MKLHPDAQAIADALGKVDMIEDYCKAVRARAAALLHEGHHVPGYKLVKGKKGNRKWSSDEIAEKILAPLGDAMFEPRCVVSPAAAEKLMKKVDKTFRIPEDTVSQSEGGLHVAPESDDRPAAVAGAVLDDFQNLTGDLESDLA